MSDQSWALIIAAAISAIGGILVAALNKFRKENHTDHQVVLGMLKILHKGQQRVEGKVERLDERLDNHIEFHASKGILDNGRTNDKDGVTENRNLSA
jgi:uncharacterized membrane protein